MRLPTILPQHTTRTADNQDPTPIQIPQPVMPCNSLSIGRTHFATTVGRRQATKKTAGPPPCCVPAIPSPASQPSTPTNVVIPHLNPVNQQTAAHEPSHRTTLQCDPHTSRSNLTTTNNSCCTAREIGWGRPCRPTAARKAVCV